MKKISNAFMAVAVMIFLISMAVMITLEWKPLYYRDIEKLNIAEASGCSQEEIIENYDALIAYNVSPFVEKLEFPSMPMSEEGEIHFREVKVIFQGFLKLFIASAVVVVIGATVKSKKGDYLYLKWASIITVVIPAIVGIMVAISWEKTFVLFHEMMFDNDYWLFDPVTDPVITILPDEFFMHCAMMIVGIMLLGAAGCFWLWRRKSSVLEK